MFRTIGRFEDARVLNDISDGINTTTINFAYFAGDLIKASDYVGTFSFFTDDKIMNVTRYYELLEPAEVEFAEGIKVQGDIMNRDVIALTNEEIVGFAELVKEHFANEIDEAVTMGMAYQDYKEVEWYHFRTVAKLTKM